MDSAIYAHVPDCKLELTPRGVEQARVGVGGRGRVWRESEGVGELESGCRRVGVGRVGVGKGGYRERVCVGKGRV